MSEPRIESISIQNIKGVPDLDFKVGTLTVITGDNGTGKTSVIDAIRSVFEGGHDPALLRQGAESGEVVFHLSDGHVISEFVTPTKTEREVRSVDGSSIGAPKTFIDKLATGFAYDPVRFMEADKKERLKHLLKARPIKFTSKEVLKATGVIARRPMGEVIDLAEIDNFRAGLYKERHDNGVTMRRLQGTVSSLRRALPPESSSDAVERAATLRTEYGQVTEKISALEGQAEAAAREQKALAKVEYERAIAAAQAAYDAKCRKIDQATKSLLDAETATLLADMKRIGEALATADAEAATEQRAIGLREQLAQQEAELKGMGVAEYNLTVAMEGIDDLKKSKLAEAINIPGLNIVDGEIHVEGVPFDELNTQKQIFFAFQVAALSPGRLKFMLCDDGEHIVGKHREAFEAGAKASGFQVIYARAEADAPLTVARA